MAYGPKPACYLHLFLYSLQVKNVFMFLNSWGGKFKQKITFHNTLKLYEVQIPVSINKVYWEHSVAIWLYIIYFCVYTTTAELNSHNMDLNTKY